MNTSGSRNSPLPRNDSRIHTPTCEANSQNTAASTSVERVGAPGPAELNATPVSAKVRVNNAVRVRVRVRARVVVARSRVRSRSSVGGMAHCAKSYMP